MAAEQQRSIRQKKGSVQNSGQPAVRWVAGRLSSLQLERGPVSCAFAWYSTANSQDKKMSGWRELNLRGLVPKTCGWSLEVSVGVYGVSKTSSGTNLYIVHNMTNKLCWRSVWV
jgi:hypothetical protein